MQKEKGIHTSFTRILSKQFIYTVFKDEIHHEVHQ